MESFDDILCKLTIGNDEFIERVLGAKEANLAASALDPRTHALVRIASLISVDAMPAAYTWAVESARSSGATDEEIVGCLVAAMPALGAARVASAAPKLGLALGYDVAAALEDSGVPVADSLS